MAQGAAAGSRRGRRAEERPAPRRALPDQHRRRWLILTVVAVVLGVGAVTGGPWVYARLVAPEPETPLSLSTPTQSAPAVDPTAPVDPDGTWSVAAGSQAGYRIGEVLTGQDVEVVGRTDQVSGSVTVTDGVLVSGRIAVQAGSISTDEAARDAYMRRALDTSTYPEAVFDVTTPTDLAALGVGPLPVEIQVPGSLTIAGVSIPATATLQVQGSAGGLEVAGSVPVVLADLGLDAPDLGFVTVQPSGQVELLLQLTR